MGLAAEGAGPRHHRRLHAGRAAVRLARRTPAALRRLRNVVVASGLAAGAASGRTARVPRLDEVPVPRWHATAHRCRTPRAPGARAAAGVGRGSGDLRRPMADLGPRARLTAMIDSRTGG